MHLQNYSLSICKRSLSCTGHPAGSLHFSIKESGHTEESASLCILVAPDHIPDLF